MPVVWGLLVSAFGWLIKSRIGLWIMTAMAWLGINWGTLKIVVEPAMDALTNAAHSFGSGSGTMGATAVAWAGVLKLDKALTMVISAYATKHSILQGRLFLFKKGFGAKPPVKAV
ncbi:DUF2523 family protein [Pseudoxanthomonas sp.]|uniref:DUF2523 family protein n=1 Tax=Pseudoxanthomonas sp. TaxID=1871049 RepID=UPI002628C07A|nr:DUF2523 family protein [Pseudoxanthomonas sp.]WDS36968.1 MAG: DUF2523 family protein [Pseudoxanthomonas sp.]